MHFFPLNEQLDVCLYCNCHKMVFYKAGKKKKKNIRFTLVLQFHFLRPEFAMCFLLERLAVLGTLRSIRPPSHHLSALKRVFISSSREGDNFCIKVHSRQGWVFGWCIIFFSFALLLFKIRFLRGQKGTV